MKNILKSKKLVTILAMALMVAMVVGMGTMTYSRYVTTEKMETPATATVADWGYVLSIDSTKMFGSKYENNAVTTDGDGSKLDVSASAAVVAPGSSGSITITLSGNAEVLAELTFGVDEEKTFDVALKHGEGTYNPIKWTLTKKVGDAAAAVVNGAENTTLALAVAALKGESAKVEAGEDIPNTVYTLSWAWAIGSENLDDATNMMDTALGMLAAGKDAADVLEATGLTVDEDASVTGLSVKLSAAVIQVQD